MKRITIIGPRRITNRLRPFPFFNVYQCRLPHAEWTMRDNLRWLQEAWQRGDWFIVIPGGGDVFRMELDELPRLNREGKRK